MFGCIEVKVGFEYDLADVSCLAHFDCDETFFGDGDADCVWWDVASGVYASHFAFVVLVCIILVIVDVGLG